jgi:hypothetical protein
MAASRFILSILLNMIDFGLSEAEDGSDTFTDDPEVPEQARGQQVAENRLSGISIDHHHNRRDRGRKNEGQSHVHTDGPTAHSRGLLLLHLVEKALLKRGIKPHLGARFFWYIRQFEPI